MRVLLAALLVSALLAGCTTPEALPPTAQLIPSTDGRGDAVVVAVIDYGFDPYHYDFLASEMPQAQNEDASDDLPLDQDPATWLPGHPGAGAFASYSAMPITLPQDEGAEPAKLHDGDDWKTQASSADAVHMRWIPGTKVVGFVDFGGDGGFSPNSHGVGTTSVSVGNLHGACPECLLVFVNGPSEVANRWVESQPWIDLQTNSWGISTVPSPVGIPRDRVYTGSDTESQRTAVERGQQIFFSAGNGLANDFSAPNPTLLSSQEGPDWMVTVGAVTPSDQSAYSGAGKPADVASIGGSYPSAGGATVKDESTFGGTSNATPVTAGLYARALYELRRAAPGASRLQVDGQIVHGDDGTNITVHQLRSALFAAAADPEAAISAAGAQTVPNPSPEANFAAYGHGVFLGRLQGMAVLDAETQRIVAKALGEEPGMSAEEVDWFIADSYCRQGIWGAWAFGDYRDGVALPANDPQWPVRAYYANGCPASLGAVRSAVAMVT